MPNISAPRDNNRVPTQIGVSSSDGTTPTTVYVDPSTHRQYVDATVSSATVSGSKTNNAAVPGATNLGTLPAVANAAAPTLTETFQTALSVDLSGNLRTSTTIAANSSVNVNQIAGTSASVNSGTKDNGTLRVVLATDQPQLTNKLLVTPDANSAINVAQINGITPLMGNGTTGTGSQRVTIASDNTAFSVNSTLGTETTKVIGTVRNLGNVGAVLDGVNTAATAPANGLLGLGIYNSTEPSPTTGQSVGIQQDSKGRLRNVIMDAAGNTRGANVTAGSALSTDITSVAGTAVVNGGVAGSQSIGGTVATNVAITDNPINNGAQAVSSENAAVTTARKVQLVADLVGKLIVLPYANPENFVSGAITSAMTGTTSTSLIAAPASGLRNYITQITVSNSHATVGTDVIIQDGSGGTTLYTIPAAAVYGGATVTFPTPLRQPTTATAIFCANVTTGSNTKVSASGYKGA